MVMMENGQGSSKARAGVFFLSVGFALTLIKQLGRFDNLCSLLGEIN
jgi:NCS1 family nucleobase:cation symporter-1